jgi:hypothetical protein
VTEEGARDDGRLHPVLTAFAPKGPGAASQGGT